MNDIHWCPICGQRATELHHIVFRSIVKPLEHCKLNHVYLCQELLTREEIQEVLKISDKPLNSLLKALSRHKDKYVREDIIRACMGGKLIE